jgi:hypothetical protein
MTSARSIPDRERCSVTGEQVSLLDTPGLRTVEWFVVYHRREHYRWWGKYLNPDFRHVELVRPFQYGPGISDVAWLQLLPNSDILDVDLCIDPRPPWVVCPSSTVQKVTVAFRPLRMRSWFDIGPFTCVEATKAALGIRAFFVRTPYQLYKYILRRNGVLISR